MQYLDAISKMTEWSLFPRQTIQYHNNPSLCPDQKCWRSWSWMVLVQFSWVIQSCPTLCDPMNCSTPGLPVHHQLPEFTETHVHRVSDAIQPSHPLSSPSLAPNPSQHQSLFQWVNSSHEVAKVLEFQLSHHSFQRNPRADLLHNGLVGSPCSLKSLLQHHTSKASILQCSAFFTIQLTPLHEYWKNHSLN